jgi:hypothetical protein
MPNSIDKNTKHGRIPPIKNNLSEQIKIFEDSRKNDPIKMNKSNTLLT